MNCEIHRSMFGCVEKWVQSRPDRGQNLNELLSAESVKAGRNHQTVNFQQTVQGFQAGIQGLGLGTSSHSTTAGGPFSMLSGQQRGLDVDDHRNVQYAQGYDQSFYQQQQPQTTHYAEQGPASYRQDYDNQYGQRLDYQQAGYGNQSYDGGHSGTQHSQGSYSRY